MSNTDLDLLEKENDKLRDDIRDLQDENNRLRDDIKDLENRVADLERGIDEAIQDLRYVR